MYFWPLSQALGIYIQKNIYKKIYIYKKSMPTIWNVVVFCICQKQVIWSSSKYWNKILVQVLTTRIKLKTLMSSFNIFKYVGGKRDKQLLP